MTDSLTLPTLPLNYRWEVEMDGEDLNLYIQRMGYSPYGDSEWLPVIGTVCSVRNIQVAAKRMVTTFTEASPFVGVYDNTGKKIS